MLKIQIMNIAKEEESVNTSHWVVKILFKTPPIIIKKLILEAAREAAVILLAAALAVLIRILTILTKVSKITIMVTTGKDSKNKRKHSLVINKIET